MEFLILLGICVLVVVGVAWFGRRRQPDHTSSRYSDVNSATLEQRRKFPDMSGD
jgi:hypothetical protein